LIGLSKRSISSTKLGYAFAVIAQRCLVRAVGWASRFGSSDLTDAPDPTPKKGGGDQTFERLAAGPMGKVVLEVKRTEFRAMAIPTYD
jgi:hypothetical protein